MLTKTKFFGEIEIDEKDILLFEEGIPGFSNLHQFVMVHPEGAEPFSYMQAIEDEKVCFVVLPPFTVVGDYSIEINDDAVNKLEIEKEEDVQIYSIVTIPEDMKEMTANLKAPVLINMKNNKAKQVILDDDKLEIRYKIIKEADASC